MPIKSFRGLLNHQEQDTIPLHTNNGSTGYRIVKFELAPKLLNDEQANTVKVTSVSKTTGIDEVSFDDQILLASGTFVQDDSVNNQPNSMITIFDNMVFNQDIYITNHDRQGGSKPINYYLELEQIKLDLNENTVATLKDIRNIEAQWANNII